MRIFLDANILFSGAKKGSPLGQFIVFLSKQAKLITHPHADCEARRNLELKRPKWLTGYKALLKHVQVIDKMSRVAGVKLNEKDCPILYAAVGCQCTHLLTGDFQHFRHLFGKTIHGVKIVYPMLLAKETGFKPSP